MKGGDLLLTFLAELLTLSASESPFSECKYGEGLDRSFAPILTFAAALLAAVRLVEPLRPRHEDR